MSEFNWTCPFCSRDQTVVESRHHSSTHRLSVGSTSSTGNSITINAVKCSNKECQKTTVSVAYWDSAWSSGRNDFALLGNPIIATRLHPNSFAKVQPDYIPIALREDYIEACLIRDLSPKGAATLARRCLQGMIRDFCGISKNRLIDEIKSLEEAVKNGLAPRDVSIESVTAIDNVRKIGNIGAHMEADVDRIISVEPEEAQILIDLIEGLFDEWYVERHKRQQRFDSIASLAASKDKQIADSKASQASHPPE